MSSPRHMTLDEAATAVRGTVSFPGYYPSDANDFAQTKRGQGLTVRVSGWGGRFKGDTQGTTKVTFWVRT